MDDPLKLAERCEAATGPSDSLNLAIAEAIGAVTNAAPIGADGIGVKHFPAYSHSLDAAMTLVPEGWGLALSTPGAFQGKPQARLKHPDYNPFGEGEAMRGSATTPALALCAAALRARSQTKGS